MKLLFLINSMSFGGAEKQVLDILIRLKKIKVDVSLVTLIEPSAFKNVLQNKGIDYYSLGLTKTNKWNPIIHFKAIVNLYFLIRKTQSDIIHTHLFHSNMYGRVVALFSNIKNISTIHSLVEKGKFRPFLYRVTDRFCSKTVFVSDSSRSMYLKNKSTSHERSCVINNGFDFNRSAISSDLNVARCRVDYNVNPDSFLWLSIGRLIPLKDYPLLLKSFLILLKEFPKAMLMIVGDGESKEEIENIISMKRLQSSVLIIEPRSNIDLIYSMSDAYISTSKYESFGMTLIEATIFSLPVVSTTNGGADEILSYENNGLISKNRLAVDIAKIMLKICLMDEEERMETIKVNYEHAKKNYDIKNICVEWLKLYSTV